VHVVVTGISHKTAPLALRERLALNDEGALLLAREVLDDADICEAMALSTCNRTELYVYAGDTLAAEQTCLGRLAQLAGVPADELRSRAYSYSGDGAIAHLFRVTASLDSMVVGEAQIVAQLKAAYQLACDGGCTSVVFNRLFRHALEVGKRVRSETAIGERPVSVSSAAVELARQVFGKLEHRVVLILGAGETSELTAVHLRSGGVARLLVSNRTGESAADLASKVGGAAVPWDEIESHLTVADIVISSTAAPHHVVTRALVETAMERRKHRPMLFIDLAVPRDLDPEIGRVADAYLYDIDDLRQVVEQNRGEREREAVRAEQIVHQELGKVNSWLRTLDVVPTIAMLRDAVESVRTHEMERLASRLSDLSDRQRRQVDVLTTSIVNKILHVPTVRMKELADKRECYLYVQAVRELFGLNGEKDGAEDAETAGDEAADSADVPGSEVHDLGHKRP
jgi:glutamyl-tRNA reductase